MKYFVFIISIFFIIGVTLSLVTLNIGDHHLSRFGWGYITGKILLLVLFLALAFFSGKKVFTGKAEA